MKRPFKVIVRLSKEEKEMLDNLKHPAVTCASYLRILIHRDMDAATCEACDGNVAESEAKAATTVSRTAN